MNKREYLNQAYRLDQRINSKLEQLAQLKALATKVTTGMSDMPGSPTRNVKKNEDIVLKIIDLENEINDRIDELVDLKKDIVHRINEVNNPEYKLILELRYLCFRSWEEIAVEMDYGIDNVFRVHRKALASVQIPESLQ